MRAKDRKRKSESGRRRESNRETYLPWECLGDREKERAKKRDRERESLLLLIDVIARSQWTREGVSLDLRDSRCCVDYICSLNSRSGCLFLNFAACDCNNVACEFTSIALTIAAKRKERPIFNADLILANACSSECLIEKNLSVR